MHRRLPTLLSLTICFVLAEGASDAIAGTIVPLPRSDYTVRAACSRPQPRHAGCLALRLVAQTAAARAHTHPLGMSRTLTADSVHTLSAAEGGDGLRPQDLRNAYFPGGQPEAPASAPQTIALVDAYNDPNVEADLAVYDSEFGLPACTAANGCLAVINQKGESGNLPFPSSRQELETAGKSTNQKRRKEAEEAGGWAVETSTDVQTARIPCAEPRALQTHAHPASWLSTHARYSRPLRASA